MQLIISPAVLAQLAGKHAVSRYEIERCFGNRDGGLAKPLGVRNARPQRPTCCRCLARRQCGPGRRAVPAANFRSGAAIADKRPETDRQVPRHRLPATDAQRTESLRAFRVKGNGRDIAKSRVSASAGPEGKAGLTCKAAFQRIYGCIGRVGAPASFIRRMKLGVTAGSKGKRPARPATPPSDSSDPGGRASEPARGLGGLPASARSTRCTAGAAAACNSSA